MTKYLGAGGLPSAVRVGSTLSYLATDGLGSVSLALDGAGNATARQLYAPYGGVRSSVGTMPTAKGFTRQRQDAATGLDYYGARYYDLQLGQFTGTGPIFLRSALCKIFAALLVFQLRLRKQGRFFQVDGKRTAYNAR